MTFREKITLTGKRIDQMLTREGFVDGTSGVLGLAAIGIGLSMLVAPRLFQRTGAWVHVFEAASPWVWASALVVCGIFMTLAGSTTNTQDKRLATIPSLVLAVVFTLMGILLTVAGSPVGVIAFGALSTLTTMVYRVYIREQGRKHVSAP